MKRMLVIAALFNDHMRGEYRSGDSGVVLGLARHGRPLSYA
jgi:hypothetical protein